MESVPTKELVRIVANTIDYSLPRDTQNEANEALKELERRVDMFAEWPQSQRVEAQLLREWETST